MARPCVLPVSSWFQPPEGRGIHLHSAAPPIHGPAATNPSSTPCITGHIYSQRSTRLNPRLLTAGLRTPCTGSTIQWPTQNNGPLEQNTHTIRARPSGHCINRSSQARLHTGRNPARHRQPTSPALQCFNKTCRNNNSTTQVYTFRARCTLPGLFHSQSSILRRVVMWEHPHIIISSIQYSVSHHNSEHPFIL